MLRSYNVVLQIKAEIICKVHQPKRPIAIYKTTMIANERLKTPVFPTYAAGVLISFSNGII